MPIPEKDKITELMDRAMAIEDKLPYADEYGLPTDESYHPDDEDDNRRQVTSTLLVVPVT